MSRLNHKLISYILGLLLLFNGLAMLVTSGVSLLVNDGVFNDITSSGIITISFGIILMMLNRNNVRQINKRDGYLIVNEISEFNCEGVSDTLHVFVDECTDIREVLTESISVYPNPASDKITLKNRNNEDIQDIVIYDMFGNTMISRNIKISNNYVIDVSSYRSGIYLIKITMESNVVIHSRFEVIK